MAWKLTTVALLGATVTAVACVQEGPSGLTINQPGSSQGDPQNPPPATTTTGTGTTGAARDMFINQVYPSLVSLPKPASCGSCHGATQGAGPQGPQYLTTTAEGSYTYLDSSTKYITVPESSMLYLHGMTVHTGPAFLPEQAELVKAWLTAEAEERGLIGGGAGGGGSTGTTKTLSEAVKEFGGCMSLTDWTDNNLQNLCDMQVDGGERCKDCHSQGQNNTWLGPDVEKTFEMNTQFPYIMRLISGTVDDEGNFKDLVESKRFQQKGQEACINPPCHPKFELSDELVAGLHQFFALTKLKYDQGPCMDSGTGGGGGAGGGP
jgi:mono/diheme cytochrome c family protein